PADRAVAKRRAGASLSGWGPVPARRRLPLFWRRDERAPKPKSSARRFVASGGRRALRLRWCSQLAREDGDLARVVSGAAALPITRLGAESRAGTGDGPARRGRAICPGPRDRERLGHERAPPAKTVRTRRRDQPQDVCADPAFSEGGNDGRAGVLCPRVGVHRVAVRILRPGPPDPRFQAYDIAHAAAVARRASLLSPFFTIRDGVDRLCWSDDRNSA